MIQTERHIAVVADSQDPESRGRIKVRSLSLLGSDDAVLNEWVEPCFDWGLFIVPDIGEQVEIEVVSGSDKDEVPGQAFLETPDYRWRGKRFYSPDTPINEMFTSSNYGKRRGFATPGGHVFMFDDTAGQEKINLVWHSAEDKYAMFSFDEDGSIILANQNGSLIYLNAAKGELAIVDEHGNSFSTDTNGIKIIDKNSNIIEMKGTTVQILSQSAVTLSCKDAVIDAGKVQLATTPPAVATEALLLGTAFLSAHATFIAALATLAAALVVPTGVPDLATKTAFATAVTNYGTALGSVLSLKSFTK